MEHSFFSVKYIVKYIFLAIYSNLHFLFCFSFPFEIFLVVFLTFLFLFDFVIFYFYLVFLFFFFKICTSMAPEGRRKMVSADNQSQIRHLPVKVLQQPSLMRHLVPKVVDL